MSVAVFRGSLNSIVSNTPTNPAVVGGVYQGSTTPLVPLNFISSGNSSIPMLLAANSPNTGNLQPYNNYALNIAAGSVSSQIQTLQATMQTYFTGISSTGCYITNYQIIVVPANATNTNFNIYLTCFYC
jgi:hypothetical protein